VENTNPNYDQGTVNHREGGCRTRRVAADLALGDARTVSEIASDQPRSIELDLDDAGVSVDLPKPSHQEDQVYGVPYRPVEFRDDDLPTALERSAAWLRRTQEWLGEPVDVIAIHLDYDDSEGSPYYDVKLLCNEEDLAGAPIALRSVTDPE
jgi:endonuclease/exonuclease/phosphatase family metal-dependent hydrolase